MPPVTGIGVGNMFSFWLWAHHGRLLGEDRWVLHTPDMDRWLDVFPEIRPLLIEPAEIARRDRRDRHWYQDFDRFPREHFDSFISERLLRSTKLPWHNSDPEAVVVNVRRGDYYSDPRLRALYGFDIAEYVRRAVEGAAAQRAITTFEVVSDDPQWCVDHLRFLHDHAPVVFITQGRSAVQDLGRLASARRLILSNSTFSYWGAHLSNRRRGDNHELVWAPRFHRRDIHGGRAFQLDPRWSVIEDPPGGWPIPAG